MKIVIAGDGKVGYTLAEQLSNEDNDIVIIDKNAEAMERANEKLDVMCVTGNALTSDVLQSAGVMNADLLIAATTNDEMNMICCVMAKKLGAKRTAARIRDYEYFKDTQVLRENLSIDRTINPEYSTALKIARQLKFPSASDIETFASERVELVAYKVQEDDKLVGKKLRDMQLPGGVLVAVVQREDHIFIPNGEYAPMVGDDIHIIGEQKSNTKFFARQGKDSLKIRNVLVAGGSRIAVYLEDLLNDLNIKMKIIETSKEKCTRLMQDLNNTLVIHGDCTDEELLESEGIKDMDAYIAITGHDEDNIISALAARHYGVPKIIVKVTRINYGVVTQSLGLEGIVSPRAIAADEIVRYVRALRSSEGTSVEKLYTLLGGRVEALEFVLHTSAHYIGVPIHTMPLKKEVLVGAIVRKNKIIIPTGDDRFYQGDKVIVILSASRKPTDFSEIFRDE